MKTTTVRTGVPHGCILDTIKLEVHSHLLSNPNKTPAEIAAAIGFSPGQVKNALYANQTIFKKHGRGGRYHPHTWTAI